MITAKDKRVIDAFSLRTSHLQARLRKIPTQKTRKFQTENVENSLIFYCVFKTLLADQVRANNHKYKYAKSKQVNIRKSQNI